MIVRVTVDGRRYELTQEGTRATLRRLTPTLSGKISPGQTKLYNFHTGTWDTAEIVRVIRDHERWSLFDEAPAGSGTP